MVTTTVVFIVAMLLGTCLESSNFIGNSTSSPDGKDFFCPGHSNKYATQSYYNDMATLMFNSQESAIKQLLHRDGAFTLPTLSILFIIYFFVTCWTYGAGISGGIFVPCLMLGAIYGRFVATSFSYLHQWQPHYFWFLTNLYPGTYALIGAASFLGGVSRMTISLTVILIESTNEIDYGLPIMLTVMVAKWVGDIFNCSLYNTHILLKKTPFLEWESPQQQDKLVAEDVMNSSGSKLIYFYPITRVHSIEQILRTTVHSAFPIVTLVKSSSVPNFPKNIKGAHTPQLYTRPSVHWRKSSSPQTSRLWDPMLGRVAAAAADYDPKTSEDDGRSFENSYTIPHKVDNDSDGAECGQKLVFQGLILRHQLVTLLKNRCFFNEADGPWSQGRINHVELTNEYPRYSDIFSVKPKLSETERNMLMDLSLYMNTSPYTISKEAPLPLVFNLFRTMGLQHLPVMEKSGIVVGIITRHDLTHETLHKIRHKKKEEALSQSFSNTIRRETFVRGEKYKSLNADQPTD